MHAHHSPRTSVVWHEDWLAALSAKFFPWLIDRLVQRRLQQVVILLYTTICSTTRLRVSGEVQVLIGAIWKYPSRRQAYTKYEKGAYWSRERWVCETRKRVDSSDNHSLWDEDKSFPVTLSNPCLITLAICLSFSCSTALSSSCFPCFKTCSW